MDYGPFLTASIEAPQPRTNIAYKGIALNLGASFGGSQNEAVVFDTDLLRYSAGWTGEFVALKGVVFDGEHWAYPRIAGQQVFGNPMTPGWASTGSLRDPREVPYGPLPRAWGHWKGLYLHERKVVLSYSVGPMSVLEMPSLERRGETTAFVRNFNLSPSSVENVVQIAFDPKRRSAFVRVDKLEAVAGSTPASQCLVVLELSESQVAPSTPVKSLDEGLSGRWEFDEANPDVALDQSPARRNLRLNDVGRTHDGHTGGAIEFAGRHVAEIARPEDFAELSQDLTAAVWVRTDADGSILALTQPGDKWVPDGRSLFIRGGRLTYDVGWVGAVAGSTVLTDGQWHHLAITTTHADGKVSLYVDGRPDGSGQLQPRQSLAAPVLRVGFTAPNFPESPWFRGRLDGLRLWHRALREGEIAALSGQSPRNDLLAAALVGGTDRAQWLVTDEGNLRLQIAASFEPTRAKVLLWSGLRESLPEFAALVKASPPAPDLEPLTHGGPPRWAEKLTTHGTLGTNDGPYAVDSLPEPDPNPWHSWMRFGGLDFFPDGRRAALSTWNGDVWVVSGVEGDLRDLTWQRIATGLFQPLGLRIVDEQIYVLGRDQITRLHDRNGDGETDFYENFNNDCMVSEHFHEFAADLKTGPDGSFYYLKCACHGTTAKHPHHGTLMKVSPDGSKLEVVARGFRANNGIGVGPRGELTSLDNQGNWMPGNRINWIRPGGWYGYQWAWNPDHRTTYDEPLCWMHNFVDRSGGTQLWVPTDQWGPFRDEIITISYGMGHIFLLLKEEVGGTLQGAVTRFPLEFETGVMRGAWHPQNGQLYACGLYGWAGNKTKAGGFYRIRSTGRPVHMAQAFHFVRDGIVLGFTDPLEPDSATDPGNYHVTAWNYQWTEDYGSPDFKLDGQEGRDTWPVESATLSADRKTVFLKVPDARRVMQLHVVFNLPFADGAQVENFVHGTIHQLDERSGAEWLGPNPIARTRQTRIELTNEAPGLVQTFISSTGDAQPDTRRSRLAALWVPAGSPPTPFLDAAPFRCSWEGFLKLELNDEITFELEGHGDATLKINGAVALEAPGGPLQGVRSQAVPLRSGLNRFELTYQSPASGDAELRLAWSSKRLPLEPVPATAFVHDADNPVLRDRLRVRDGRRLFAEHQCARCHPPTAPGPAPAMPELAADAPAFDDIGTRLKPSWVTQWLLDPKSARPDARMPRMLSGPPAAIDAADIAAHLAHLRGVHSLPPPQASPVATDLSSRAEGVKQFADLGCVACHSLPGELTLTNDTRVPLNHVTAKWDPSALETFLRAPAIRYRWTPMPDFKLTTREVTALATFVLERAQTDPRWPVTGGNAPVAKGADAKRGGELVAALGCLRCHTLDRAQDQFQAPTLPSLTARDWTRGCLGEDDPARGRAPDFRFDAASRAALRAFAGDGFPEALAHDAAAEFAERSYLSLRCNACHPRDLETDLLTQLGAAAPKPTNPYDDDGFGDAGGSVHVGRPLLSYAGEKLYAGWMRRFLDGSLSYKPRPELQGRMPAFAPYAAGLAEGAAHQHGYRAETAPAPRADPDLAEIGRRLTLVDGGFSCVACHDVGTRKALAGKDTATVNFACVADRLRLTYYWRYVQDPPRLVPSTMMPKFIGDDGTTPIKTVFGGDPQKQFTAIWHYLMSLQAEAAPFD